MPRLSRKSIAPALLIGLLLPAPLAARAQAPAAARFRPPGDIDGDLRVTIKDAIEALRILSKLRTFTADDLAVLDVSPSPGTNGRLWGDGVLTIADVIRILRRAVGAEPDPWPGGPAFSPSTARTQFTLTQAGGPYIWTTNTGAVVNGQLIDENNRPLSATLYFWDSSHQLLGTTRSDSSGRFTFASAPGFYQISTVTPIPIANTSATLAVSHASIVGISTRPGMGPITVRRGPVPNLFQLTGTLLTVPAGLRPIRVELIDAAHQFDIAPPATLATAPVDPATGRFTAFLPPGMYRPLVELQTPGGSGTVFALPNSTVTVAANRSVMLIVPPEGTLSGTVSIANCNCLVDGRVEARTTLRTDQGGGASGAMSLSRYTIPLQSQVTYDIAFEPGAPVIPAASLGSLAFVLTSLQVQTLGIQNVLLPVLPVLRPMTMWIGDALGRPLPNGRLRLISQALVNADPRYQERTLVTADAQGVLNLTIPEGLYTILVEPPATLPSVEPVTGP